MPERLYGAKSYIGIMAQYITLYFLENPVSLKYLLKPLEL